MSVILARSPYFIVVDENLQTSAKVELYIWNKGDSEPVAPTRTLEKPIASSFNRSLEFNISPYLLKFIDIEIPSEVFNSSSLAVQEYDGSWCIVKVKAYYKTATSEDWELLNENVYAAVNGYSYYTEGLNYAVTNDMLYPYISILANNSYTRYIEDVPTTPVSRLDYFNVIIEHDGFGTTSVEYDYTSQTETLPLLTGADDAGYYNFCIPYIYLETGPIGNTPTPNTIQIVTDLTEDAMPIFNVEQLCEPKYDPVRCQFVNRLGGWDSIWFFKAKSEQYDVTNSNYQLAQLFQPNFNGQTKQFNYTAKQSITLNTGWVDEAFADYILDLLTSQQIWLDSKPAVVKSKSQQKKTYIKDKNINYTIEFEFNYNVINDQI